MRDCHVFHPCGGQVRDAIMPECLDKAHWESWALTIPMNFNHSSPRRKFQISLPDKRLSAISAGKRLSWPSHLNITVSVYIIVCILFVGQSWTFQEDAPVGYLLFFFVHIAGQDLTFDLTGQRSYMEACEKLHVVPSSAFLRQIQSNEMLLMHRCLGPQVSCDQAAAFSRVFPSWIQLVALDRSNKYAQIVCV